MKVSAKRAYGPPLPTAAGVKVSTSWMKAVLSGVIVACFFQEGSWSSFCLLRSASVRSEMRTTHCEGVIAFRGAVALSPFPSFPRVPTNEPKRKYESYSASVCHLLSFRSYEPCKHLQYQRARSVAGCDPGFALEHNARLERDSVHFVDMTCSSFV